LNLGIENKVALETRGSTGIGRAAPMPCTAAGAGVVSTYHTNQHAAENVSGQASSLRPFRPSSTGGTRLTSSSSTRRLYRDREGDV